MLWLTLIKQDYQITPKVELETIWFQLIVMTVMTQTICMTKYSISPPCGYILLNLIIHEWVSTLLARPTKQSILVEYLFHHTSGNIFILKIMRIGVCRVDPQSVMNHHRETTNSIIRVTCRRPCEQSIAIPRLGHFGLTEPTSWSHGQPYSTVFIKHSRTRRIVGNLHSTCADVRRPTCFFVTYEALAPPCVNFTAALWLLDCGSMENNVTNKWWNDRSSRANIHVN